MAVSLARGLEAMKWFFGESLWGDVREVATANELSQTCKTVVGSIEWSRDTYPEFERFCASSLSARLLRFPKDDR
jgi:hypothetical protein